MHIKICLNLSPIAAASVAGLLTMPADHMVGAVSVYSAASIPGVALR